MKFFLTYIAVFLFNFAAIACDCERFLEEEESEFIFIGEVKKITKVKGNIRKYKVELIVTSLIKGKQGVKTAVVFTPCLDEVCCGISFIVGKEYYVLTVNRDGNLFTNLCCGTTVLDQDKSSNR